MADADRLRSRLADLVRARRAAPHGNGLPEWRAEMAAADGASSRAGVLDSAAAHPPAGAPPTTEALDSAGAPATSAAPERPGVEEYLPGGEWRDGRGAVYVHERLRSEIERFEARWGTLGAPAEDEPDLEALAAAGLERALFLDLETGGLASSPVFLAGTMHWNGADFVVRQYFARHYGEEATLLGALAEAAREFEFLVTFNGKSYDAPFLACRAAIHGVPLSLPKHHVDLLHPARRRWKDRLPDCRLQTLEFHVCHRRRSGDVPSEEVPALYHDFVRRGDPYRLVPVFHHNMLDVITMAEILAKLCARDLVRRDLEPLEWGWPEAPVDTLEVPT